MNSDHFNPKNATSANLAGECLLEVHLGTGRGRKSRDLCDFQPRKVVAQVFQGWNLHGSKSSYVASQIALQRAHYLTKRVFLSVAAKADFVLHTYANLLYGLRDSQPLLTTDPEQNNRYSSR